MTLRCLPRRPSRLRLPSPPSARRALLAATLAAAFASAASAQDGAPSTSDLRVNGFGTLGLVDVLPHDGLGFRRDINQSARHDEHLAHCLPSVQDAAAGAAALDAAPEGVIEGLTEA